MTEQHFTVYRGQAQLYHGDYSCLPRNKTFQQLLRYQIVVVARTKTQGNLLMEVLTVSLGESSKLPCTWGMKHL